MSTIVYQQNQASIYEPHLSETTLKLRVAAAPPPTNADLGGWGFLQNNSQESSTMINRDFPYTHPLSKNSKLSPQSLQLCTENLGSESGSDTFSDCSSIFSASPPPSPTAARIPPPADKYSRKINNFPPPLTTMSGASSLQVRRRSDGGRLIIDAVEGPFRNSYLHAERTDGRLKLSFAAAACSDGDEEECGAAEAAETETEAEEGEIEGKGNGFESELGVEKNVLERIQSFRRCNSHGSKGLCSNWKPSTLWVATS
ncbi:protein FANTASTIC FOUR 1-like [Salvia hispanica]|uniref:protein FANTASTIC FOUR 1-like n=1 Tax=Salvia hispanica TaxID=49212 RepID=UPI002008F249|nr:protein FANTASTIC FOUR 1-like [Salvia hispanica]